MLRFGCYAQVAKEELQNIDEIDLVLGNNEKTNILECIEEYMQKNIKEEVKDVMHQSEFLDFGSVTYTEKTRAVIKVQDGCDRFCSYCIIPYARGRVRSRKPESILKEIEKISKIEGIKEVVITGIHVASYGRDFKNSYRLIDLLEDINKIEGIKRIRLGSLEPTLITEDFVSRLTKLEKICDHFHLSLQSGCDETLKRMNRKYTTSQFKICTNLLKKAYPNVSLTTDIIVGFPGETDEEFEKTYSFLKDIDFYKMHIFKYSKRKGTKAAIMKNQIDGNIKEQRSRRLIELSDNNEKSHNSKYVGKEVEVLFEEKDVEGYVKGHTNNYIVVKVKSKAEIEDRIKNVTIIKNMGDALIGILK